MQNDKPLVLPPSLWSVSVQAVIPALAGAFFLYKGRPVWAGVLFGIGATMLISGLFIPALFMQIERIGQAVGRGFAVGLTWTLLVPVYCLMFVPVRLILKIRGVDPMCRQFPTDAGTYWVPRKPVLSLEEYKRQF